MEEQSALQRALDELDRAVAGVRLSLQDCDGCGRCRRCGGPMR